MTGEVVEGLGFGELEVEADDIGGEFLEGFDAAGEGFDLEVLSGGEFGGVYGEVGEGGGLAEEGFAGGDFVLGEGGGVVFAVVNFALYDGGFAGTACAVATAVGEEVLGAEGGVYDAFTGLGGEAVVGAVVGDGGHLGRGGGDGVNWGYA